MNTLLSERVSKLLNGLHREAEAADHEHVGAMMARVEAAGENVQALAADLIAEERRDYRATYRRGVTDRSAPPPRRPSRAS